MTPPPAAPQIHPPFVVGVHPGTPLLWTVPVTGEAPPGLHGPGPAEGPDAEPRDGDDHRASSRGPATIAVQVTVRNAAGRDARDRPHRRRRRDRADAADGLEQLRRLRGQRDRGRGPGQRPLRQTLPPALRLGHRHGGLPLVRPRRARQQRQRPRGRGPDDGRLRATPARPQPLPVRRGRARLQGAGRQDPRDGPASSASTSCAASRATPSRRTCPSKAPRSTPPTPPTPSDTCGWCPDMYGVRGDTPAGQAYYDSLFRLYASWGVDYRQDGRHVRAVPHGRDQRRP